MPTDGWAISRAKPEENGFEVPRRTWSGEFRAAMGREMCRHTKRIFIWWAACPGGSRDAPGMRGGGADVLIGFLRRLVNGRRRPIVRIFAVHAAHFSRKVRAYVE